jgi:hypothetical protein
MSACARGVFTTGSFTAGGLTDFVVNQEGDEFFKA